MNRSLSAIGLTLSALSFTIGPARAQSLHEPVRLERALEAAVRDGANGLLPVADREYLLPVGLGFRVDLMLATVDSSVEYERLARVGNEVELEDEVPFDDDEPAFHLKAWVRIGPWAVVEGSYLRFDSRSEGRTRNAFIWDKVGFSVGERVETEYALEMAWFGVRAVVTDERKVTASIPIGVLWTGQRLVVERLVPLAGGGGDRASERVDSWSPYVGVHGQGVFWDDFGELGYEAQLLFFAYPGLGYLDLSASLTYGFRDFVRIYLGPRVIVHTMERENDDEQDRTSKFNVVALVFGASVGF